MTTPATISFSDPRFSMTSAGRFLVRVSGSAGYAITLAAAFIALLSDLSGLRALGALLALFLLDSALHAGHPRRALSQFRGGRANSADYLSGVSQRILESAFQKARFKNVSFPILVLQSLSERREIRTALERMDVPPDRFEAALEAALMGEKTVTVSYSDVGPIVVAAFGEALKSGSIAIEPKDLFAGLVAMKHPAIVRIMASFEIGDDDLESVLVFAKAASLFMRPRHFGHFFGEPARVRHRIMNRAWSARPTPTLDQFGEDLTDLAREGEGALLIGHEKEYRALLDVLSRPGNKNALIVGDPGAGKDALLHRLAFDIARDHVPAALFDRRLVSLSIGNLVAGASQSDIEGRAKKILDEIATAGNVILYIPEIHNLVRTGGAGSVSAADVLLPALKGDGFSLIGATYPREYRQYVEPLSDFAGSFELIRVNEISEAEATRLMVYESVIMERSTGVIISFRAIKQAVTLAKRYFRQKLLPASARELLSEALAAAKSEKKELLEPSDIIRVAERRVNVPIHEAERGEAQKLLHLEETIHERLVDQNEAVTAIARSIREYRSGLSRRGGPIASFLFVGPTGVGKTELAKIVTRVQFGDEKLMTRFDMSEYQTKESITRFLGTPDGSAGGTLTDAVRERPYSLILLDEFEKAHPDILNLFLQVMDDGRLTDSIGRTVDFGNTIIIATSNAHSEFIKTEIEKKTPVPEIGEQLKSKLGDYFRAELLNRFSAIIVFKPLSLEDVAAVSKLALGELATDLRERHGIELHFDETIIREVARLGFDPVFGARPLRRVVSDKLRAVLAEELLAGSIERGATIDIALENGNFAFHHVQKH